MNVKNALHDKCASTINHLNQLIEKFTQANEMLAASEARPNEPAPEWRIKHNLRTIETYKDEIVELEDLRDGHINASQLGTARRFFNDMPAWGTYGT
jgi:hypothetical protein